VRRNILVLVLGVFLACSGNEIASDPGSGRTYEPDRIYGQVTGLPGRKILLFELYGDRVTLIDSAMAATDGTFEFGFPSSRHKGLYRIAMGKPSLPGVYEMHLQQFDLVWDGRAVAFETNYAAPVDSMRIILSEENRLYYELLRQMDDYARKISILSAALVHYPPEDNFYNRLERQYRRVQNRRSNFIDNLIRRNKGTIAASIARFYRMPRFDSPFEDTGISGLRKDFFSPGQFSDPVLLRTDLIPLTINRYLSLYREPGISNDEQQELMISAVDVIMEHAMANEAVYYFVIEYLTNSFLAMGNMDQVIEHLSGRYLYGNVCFQEGRLLDSPTAGTWKPEPGAAAPGFSFTALDGRQVDLHKLESEYTIVLFWGTWCPHCENVMEGLSGLYNRYSGQRPGFLEVVAIGIEDQEHPWREYIEEHGYNWINFSAYKKWDCEIARLYNPAGTPAMFLLDRDKRFVQEPMRIRQLERYLSQRL
jgi:thiol-disulfide isomerase/thioredoxin